MKLGNSFSLKGKYCQSSLNRKKLFTHVSEMVGNPFIWINQNQTVTNCSLPEVKHKTFEFEVIDTGPLQPATTEVRLQGASLHLLSFLFPSGTTWLQSLPEPPPAHQQPPCKTSGCTLTQRTCWTLQLVNKFNSAGSGEKT